MQSLSEKRQARLQRKKQQLAALVTVTKLNDMDKKMTEEPDAKRFRSNDTGNDDNPIEMIAEAKKQLTDEQYKEYKKMMRARRKLKDNIPKLRLREYGEYASMGLNESLRTPIFLNDIQHLIMYSQIGTKTSYSPARWCQLDKQHKLQKTNVFIIENVSVEHFVENEASFPFLDGNFDVKLELLSPNLYNGDTVRQLATVSVTSTQMRRYMFIHGTMDEAAEKCAEIFDFTKEVFPMDKQIMTEPTKVNKDKFSRTDIMLSSWQLVEENYPLPIKGLWERKYVGYALTKEKYAPVTSTSPMFGLDCEMCITTINDSELTRVSIVNEKYETIYDELVMPPNEIIDYLTRFSGITAKMMKGVTKRLEDVQKDLSRLLPPDAILVGQSLSNDMHALKMMHPYIIDTSILYNITGEKGRKTKLKTLSMEFLSESIQEGNSGHCSTEDSIAALKLAQLKLSKDIYFGDATLSNIQSQVKQHVDLGTTSYATSMFKLFARNQKRSFIVCNDDLAFKYCQFTFKKEKYIRADISIKKASDNNDVVQKMVNKPTWNIVVGHIKLTNDEISNGKDTFVLLDQWIKQIHDASTTPALNIVIFVGGANIGNGCCFINIKT